MTDSGLPATEVKTATQRAAVVFNPSKSGVDKLRAAVASAEKTHGWAESVWLETEIEDPGKGMAQQALKEGVDLVIAAGGDGTVRSVAAAMRGTGVAMGIVPAGTGNLFARNVDIPVNNVEAAVEVAMTGSRRVVDVLKLQLTRPDGSTERHVSLVMSGIGIDAAMISNTNDQLKKKVGWLAYVDAGLRVLPAMKPFAIRYQLRGHRPHQTEVSTILIANLGYLPGNIELIPEAKIDDGRLDVAMLQPKSFWGWIMIWRRVTLENKLLRKTALGQQYIDLTGGDKRTEIIYKSGTAVRIELENGPEEFELDGDEFGEVTSVAFENVPQSLVVHVPAH